MEGMKDITVNDAVVNFVYRLIDYSNRKQAIGRLLSFPFYHYHEKCPRKQLIRKAFIRQSDIEKERYKDVETQLYNELRKLNPDG